MARILQYIKDPSLLLLQRHADIIYNKLVTAYVDMSDEEFDLTYLKYKEVMEKLQAKRKKAAYS